MTIQVSQEDFDFLKELQHELNTQTTDGNAQPVYWGVIETREVGVPDGCGEPRIYIGDGECLELDGAIEYANEYCLPYAEDDVREIWEGVDKEDMNEVCDFIHDHYNRETRIVYVDYKHEISQNTGAFLTKRACKEYIDKFGYNHSRPHTFAMTAYRNFELARLLKILRTMEF